MSPVSQRLSDRASLLFGIDVRSLAVFRIGLGVLLLLDLAVRATALTGHYTDAGVLPRETLYELSSRTWFLSLHLLSGGPVLPTILFLTAAGFAVALLVGYHTRWATLGSWVLLLSLHVRNPYVLNSGDVILLLLLFWGLFLPLGARWSVDALRNPDVERPPRFVSVASLAVLLQICFIYWFSVGWKSDPIWTADHSAVYYALNLDRHATRLGLWLLDHASLDTLRLMTQATLAVELFVPFLAFVPVLHGPLRTLTAVVFISFHAGLALALELGLFPYICIAAWAVFLPSWFWDDLLPALSVRRFRGPAASAAVPFRTRLASNLVAGAALVYVFTYNLDTLQLLHPSVKHGLFDRLTPYGEAIGLNQTWRMFAPAPTAADGWYAMTGTLETGVTVDVFQDGPALDGKPALVSALFHNQRWRKFLGERLVEHRDVLAPHLTTYLWNRWHERHADGPRLVRLELVLMNEATPPPFAQQTLKVVPEVLDVREAGSRTRLARTR